MSDKAAHRAAYERRVWRLAYLLSGDPAGAALLVDRVIRDQPDFAALEPARLDRVVIQHARELPRARTAILPIPLTSATPAAESPARKALDAVLSLSEQPREVWVLARVDELDELHFSRAMDCSRTASRNHLAAADDHMAKSLSTSAAEAAATLRAFADGLDPAPIIQSYREHARKRRLRLAAYFAGAMLVGLLIISLALLQGWFI
jgi:hypothetical protein